MFRKSPARIPFFRFFAVALAFAAIAPRMAAAEEPTLRIAFPSGMNGQLVVAMEKAGIAKKNGLNASFTPFQYGPPMMEALAAGSIDAVVTSLMPVTSYASKVPGDVKIVAMLGHSSHSLMVGKDSPAKTPADLAGKKLGVSFGSDSHLDTMVWLKDEELDDKIKLVNVPPAELANALGNNSVDAIVIRQPQVLRLEERSGARILHTWPFRFVSIVKTKFIDEHPEAAARYLKSLQDSLFYVAQHKEQAATWFGELLRMDPALIMAVSKEDANYEATKLSDIDVSVTPASKTLITKWAKDAYAHKRIKTGVDIEKLF
ncbi:MAG: NrtA/SsuA/CpmA family ABC transporter substrate-binding protein [Pseudolabrys sp.]|nr:NrtA/SsuA/CpmA family ABC transporter substrate-binding protein [Pseudolabrys sp.]